MHYPEHIRGELIIIHHSSKMPSRLHSRMTTRVFPFHFVLSCLCIVFGIVSYTPQAQAQEPEASEALGRLLKLLDTKISTGSHAQPADITPGVVTILEKKTLLATGVRTVAEALTLIPGFGKPEPQLNNDEPVFRGLGGIYTGSSGKIRYMVNGIVTNNTISANSSLVLQMPVDQIERIEVISGPGAAIYGEYALLGVINVITEQSANFAYARFTDYDTQAVGGHYRWEHSPQYHSSLNVSLWQSDGGDINSGTDILYALGQPELSVAPGQPNLKRRFLSAFYNLDAKNWSLTAFLLGDQRGDRFGAANALSGSTEFTQKTSQYGVEWKTQAKVNSWIVNSRIAAKHYQRKNENTFLLPAGIFRLFEVDLVTNSNEGENRFELASKLSRQQGTHHQLLGVELSESKSEDISFEATFDESTLLPGLNIASPLAESTTQPLGLENKSRRISSLYFSDQYQPSDRLQFVSGLRVDHYSDIRESSLFSPRVSASYRKSTNHLLKAQYARAFRPPSFSELHYRIGLSSDGHAGNPDLDSEIIDTLEFVHSYRDKRSLLRTTLFASRISDLIRHINRGRFENVHDVDSQGIELDFEHNPRLGIRWLGNLSYVEATNTSNSQPLEGSIRWLGNLGFNWQPRSRYSTTIRYQYVGERFRAPDDRRDKLGGYSIINLHGLIHDFLSPGLSLRLGINNLFDKDTFNPAPTGTYINDYPAPGREIWLQLSLKLD